MVLLGLAPAAASALPDQLQILVGCVQARDAVKKQDEHGRAVAEPVQPSRVQGVTSDVDGPQPALRFGVGDCHEGERDGQGKVQWSGAQAG